jgi:branched-chain amino acid transport system ATP-binding protein
MASALELRHVVAGYGETVVLEDVNLALERGDCISVIGRNGVGKSTLLATVMGHTTLHKGEVMLGGQRLDRVPVFRRARSGLGFVPQEREIFPSLTVRENLEVAARPGIGRRRGCSSCSRTWRRGCPTRATSSRAGSSRCSRSRGRS